MAMELADFEANGKVIQPGLREILRGCLKPLPEDRPTVTRLREQMETLNPSDSSKQPPSRSQLQTRMGNSARFTFSEHKCPVQNFARVSGK